MLCVPPARLVVLHAAVRAVAASRTARPPRSSRSMLPPSVKLTVPVGLVPVTVAVKRNGGPAVEGFSGTDERRRRRGAAGNSHLHGERGCGRGDHADVDPVTAVGIAMAGEQRAVAEVAARRGRHVEKLGVVATVEDTRTGSTRGLARQGSEARTGRRRNRSAGETRSSRCASARRESSPRTSSVRATRSGTACTLPCRRSAS